MLVSIFDFEPENENKAPKACQPRYYALLNWAEVTTRSLHPACTEPLLGGATFQIFQPFSPLRTGCYAQSERMLVVQQCLSGQMLRSERR